MIGSYLVIRHDVFRLIYKFFRVLNFNIFYLISLFQTIL